jgi:hypothetical protein
VEGDQKADPTPIHFADDPLHLVDRPKFQIDHGCVLEEMLEERAPFGEPELAEAAFRGMTGGEEKRGAQLRQSARRFA